MKRPGSDILSKPLVGLLLPSTRQQFAVFMASLFICEILVMQLLPHLISKAPRPSIIESMAASLILTALSAPLLWRLITRQLRRFSRIQSERAELVLQDVVEGIVCFSPQGKIVSFNPAAEEIFGYSADELLHKDITILFSKSDDVEAGFSAASLTPSASGKNSRLIRDLVGQRKDGGTCNMDLSISELKLDETSLFMGIMRDTQERRDADERIYFMAHYDALTGLPNRVLLHDRILQAIVSAPRLKRKVAILFLDLDRFKTINDSLGHSIGDLLLQAVAERLKGCIRSSDTVARLGGDEFIVVLPDLPEGTHAATVAQKILDTISTPFMIRDVELNTSASIGISLYPDDGVANEDLVANADVAMYRSKEHGRNNYHFFAPQMNDKAYERLTMENSLRRALDRQEFVLYYQPQVHPESGLIIGAEALVRWKNPERGLVPPGMFIPIAEETGLIVAIGDWVLREACRQNKAWQDEGLPSIPVAVNLSAVQFRQKGLADSVADALRQSGLEPQWLELEITESAIMQNAEAAIKTLRSLKQMGLKLSIDDFGTGYSSLSYLKKFPLDKLKIDQSFVRDITTDQDDASIVTAIIGMAKNLKLRVIAEGVETRGHLDFLTSNGCVEIQGFYFGKPVPADEFRHLLAHGLWSEELCRDCRLRPESLPDQGTGEHPCAQCIYNVNN